MTPDPILVQRLMEASEEDLYATIGEIAARSASPRQRQQLSAIGKGWFDAARNELSRIVCSNERLKRISAQDVPTHELVVAVCGTLDLGVHILGGVPAVTVAVLIVRLGLHQFCATQWSHS
jgi:hypothetical protein